MWLIVGAYGQLGRCMTDLLDSKSIDYIAAGHQQIDITNSDSVNEAFERYSPKFVLNAAAWTAVDEAENHEDAALRTNAGGPANLAISSSLIGARLIHISTDYVFSGESHLPYTVGSLTEPSNAYGRTKLAGEKAVLEIGNGRNCVVRTAWLYSEYGKNFAKTMANRALSAQPVQVVNDQVGQPTSAHDLAQLIYEISQLNDIPTIVHGTSSGETSWFEFAQEIYSQLGADPELARPVDSSAFPTVARRPAYSVLDHNDFDSWGLAPIQNWKTGLSEAIDRIRDAVQKEQLK
jgi:dTDP-4-dehydrorhamnose reductase